MVRRPYAAEDRRWMRAALTLAERGLGRVAPNPAVGCILVKNGRIVGRGWTQPGGRPHAETEALDRAGQEASRATAYVTLEPCSHDGETGPCAKALINAGIIRVVVAMEDPDTRVSGRGLSWLRAAGVTVDFGVLEDEARTLNMGFWLHRTEGRPLVTLKLATTLDGKIATASGESKWITGDAARTDAHLQRMRHDAVLVGVGTAAADDPALTCRLPGVRQDGVRVVLDTHGRLPSDSQLCDGTTVTLQIVGEGCESPALVGVERLVADHDKQGQVSVPSALRILANSGITRLLVEGGGRVAASFLSAGCVDRLVWYRAAGILGSDARSGVAELGLSALADTSRFRTESVRRLGNDLVEELVRE